MISRIYSGTVLCLAILTSLATSGPNHQRVFAVGRYPVKSDCPGAQAAGELDIQPLNENDFESPDHYTLVPGTVLGFPSDILQGGRVRNADAAAEAKVEGPERACQAQLWETQENSGLFLCYHGDELECTIHLQKI